jgi:hypothetical protein
MGRVPQKQKSKVASLAPDKSLPNDARVGPLLMNVRLYRWPRFSMEQGPD